MVHDPDGHHRRSIRLKEYDYTQPGAYFVTVCVQDGVCLFGKVVGGEMRLNSQGRIAKSYWREIPEHFPHVMLDAFVIMPNHMHGIIGIVGDGKTGVGATHASPLQMDERPAGPKPKSLGATVGLYKPAVTRRINSERGISGVSVWQRNYYEHVIRGHADLECIRRYIEENPGRWRQDQYFAA